MEESTYTNWRVFFFLNSLRMLESILYNDYYIWLLYARGPPWWLSGRESSCHCRRPRFNPCIRKIPWRRKWQPTPVFLPGKSCGQRSLAGYSPWGRKRVRPSWVTQQQQTTHTYYKCRALHWYVSVCFFLSTKEIPKSANKSVHLTKSPGFL